MLFRNTRPLKQISIPIERISSLVVDRSNGIVNHYDVSKPFIERNDYLQMQYVCRFFIFTATIIIPVNMLTINDVFVVT